MPPPPQRLRICIALPGLHRVQRGAETAFEELGREIALLGHDVTLIGSGEPIADRPYRFIHAGSRPREKFEQWPKFPPLRSHYAWEELSFLPALWRAYRPADYDLTVTCGYPFANWLLRSGLGQKPKHIFVTQNGDWMVHAGNREYRFFGCDGLVCTNSEYFARNKDRYPSALIPNGVNPAMFAPGEGNRAEYGLPEGAPIVLMVSALIPSKRVLEAIRAISQTPDVHLVVAGDGELRDAAQQLGEALLPGRFHRITLPRARMPGVYRCADVFLHMSVDEPSANAYMEALATGLPIVTHDWAVTRWTLEDLATLVDATDLSAVAAATQAAFHRRGAALVEASRALVARRFAWSSIAGQYCDFFRAVLAGEPAAPSPSPGAPAVSTDFIGAVAIGRNEGQRLIDCLTSLQDKTAATVYVDSDSTDGSVEAARRLGATVIELDTSIPFTAARARNAGWTRLLANHPQIKYVQFVDGDCQLANGWIETAAAALEQDEQLAAVCGRRRERYPEKSVYNRLCDIEWNTPIGLADAVGGDAMFRTEALRQVEGYDPTLIAGEEPEMCLRMRSRGWKIRRLDAEMTLHDAAMTRLGQWWKRNVRAGHAYAEGAAQHPGYRKREVRSNVVYGTALPALALALGCWRWWIGALLLCIYPLLMLRIAWRIRRSYGRDAGIYGFFVTAGKFPQAWGQAKYWTGRLTGKRSGVIEYKGPTRPMVKT